MREGGHESWLHSVRCPIIDPTWFDGQVVVSQSSPTHGRCARDRHRRRRRCRRTDRLWCHLASDTSFEELHAFVAPFDVPARGFDGDHYDVPVERRDDLIAAGATPVTSRELVAALNARGLRRRRPRSAKGT